MNKLNNSVKKYKNNKYFFVLSVNELINNNFLRGTKMADKTEKKFEILIVDDSEITRKTIVNMIKRNLDIEVFEAEHAMAALRLIGNHEIDLILMDVIMPEVDGFKASRIIRSQDRFAHIPIVFMTASDPTKEKMKYGFESGGIDYLSKPFTEIELSRLITLYMRFINREKERNSILEQNNKKLSEEITHRRQALRALTKSEKDLKEANSTKDTFFSIIAHDLKNPIGSFKNILELLVQDYDEMDEEDKLEFLTLMNDSAKNLYELLENLLDWSRTQTGSLSVSPEPFHLKNITEDVISLLNMNAKNKNIDLICEVSDDLMVFADINSVNTVIRNLVSNSIKFTERDGTISIVAEERGDDILIKVKDTGIGMSGEDIEKAFKIEEHHTTKGTENESGTGLGLILCREFIQKNNGELWIESEQWKGTCVCFTLPGV